MNIFADGLSATNFTIKNNTTNKVINVFGLSVGPGNSVNLLNMAGIYEADIKTSLSKGVLYRKIVNGELKITGTDLDLTTLNTSLKTTLLAAGVPAATLFSSSGGVQVSNRASITSSIDDTTLSTGYILQTTNVLAKFQLDKTSTLTVNNVGVVATKSGTGRWLRIAVPMQITQGAFFIDPTNTSGTASDENDGATSITPLVTFTELEYRIRNCEIVSTSQYFTVNVMSSPTTPTADPFSISCYLKGNRSLLLVGTRTRSGSTFTSTSGLTSPTGTAFYQVSANWPGAVVPARGTWVRVVGGANAGTVFQIDKDLGSNVARISRPSKVDRISSGLFSAGSITNGDTLEIITIPQLDLGYIDLKFEDTVGGAGGSYLSFNAFSIDGVRLSGNLDALSISKTTFFQAFESTFDNSLPMSGLNIIQNCWLKGGIPNAFPGATFMDLFAGMSDALIVPPRGMARLIVDQNHLAKAGVQCVANATVDVINVGFFDIAGDAIFIQSGGTVRLEGTTPFSGNTGFGINVQAAGTLAYLVTPTLSGSSGDFRCGQSGTLAFFRPDTGAFVAAQAQTWTNFNTALGSGGFGGNVINIGNAAKILLRT